MAKKIIRYDVALKSTKPAWQTSVPKVYTNDLNSVVFQFVISDLTTEEQEVATAVTMLYMRDGSFFQNPSEDVDKVGNVFSYTLKENEGNHAGIAKIQLVVTIPETDPVVYATQMYEFEVVNGLETKVAQEVMIYDWTTLTRDAQDYIDQFVSDEVLRDAQFDNNEFDRNITFVETQGQRAADFTAAQDSRTATFNASEVSRTQTFTASETAREQEFDLAESGRAAGYTADHNRAETDHTIAVDDSEQAGTDHTTAVSDHTLAGTDHTRAESDHTRADADSATVAGFNTRLTAEETATAANKISAVKGKTFADVDARFEDIEFDTATMGTNLVTNGDFSNGTTGWTGIPGYFSVVNGALNFLADGQYAGVQQIITGAFVNRKMYISALVKFDSVNVRVRFTDETNSIYVAPKTLGSYERISDILKTSASVTQVRIKPQDDRASGWTTQYVDNVIVIDLTAAFGAGNEPTAEQMDGILAKFTNSWFDGTANLFRANATLNKLMAVDARTEFEAKNSIINGDMSKGITGWTGTAGVLASVNNVLVFTGDGTGQPITTQNLSVLNPIPGNKIYVSGKARVTNAVCVQLYMRLIGATGGSYNLLFATAPFENTWYSFNGIVTLDSTFVGSLGVKNVSVYADAATANGKATQIQYVSMIDLTATFGAGKEPTLAEMDRLMARFPNSWFDGGKPIQTIETLYQEKANKVQEAWITPTLLNSWVADVNNPVGYYKSEDGEVRLKGVLNSGTLSSASPALTLPAGYRPLKTKSYIGFSNYPVAPTPVTLSVSSTGSIYIDGTKNINVTLDSVTFRAEA